MEGGWMDGERKERGTEGEQSGGAIDAFYSTIRTAITYSRDAYRNTNDSFVIVVSFAPSPVQGQTYPAHHALSSLPPISASSLTAQLHCLT